MFVRFVVSARHAGSEQRQGVFTAIYALERDGELMPYEREWFDAIEQWFNANLARPSRLSPRAIFWLKVSAIEHVSRMRQLTSYAPTDQDTSYTKMSIR